MRSARDGAVALRAALRAQGGTVSEVLHQGSLADECLQLPGPPQLAASGPRASGRELEYELLLEMILEGSRLHYGSPRIVLAEDPDLALLLGDQLYALGLERLAEIGDLAAVSELGDLISLVAQAHAAADPPLADAVWEAGAVAVGWGASQDYEAAKVLARAGDRRATEALLEAAAVLRAARRG